MLNIQQLLGPQLCGQGTGNCPHERNSMEKVQKTKEAILAELKDKQDKMLIQLEDLSSVVGGADVISPCAGGSEGCMSSPSGPRC